MPFFDVKIPLGPIQNQQHEKLLTDVGFRIDRFGDSDASCLFFIVDGHGYFDINLDCVDLDSARLNAWYMVNDELQRSGLNPIRLESVEKENEVAQ